MKKTNFFVCALWVSAVVPRIVFAQISTFRDLMQVFIGIAGYLIAVLYAAGFAGFFWGISLFILNRDDTSKREEGKKWIVWSLVALFAMITAWGLVGVLVNTFGISINVIPQLPGA